jgi:hypothetical protein
MPQSYRGILKKMTGLSPTFPLHSWFHDDGTVELRSGNGGAFMVQLHLFQFHKRMMLSKEIAHEFIARSE